MSGHIHIQDGRLLDPGNNIDQTGSLYISDGLIVDIGDQAPANFKADSVINAQGLYVCPGLIDLAARLREPGAENKANIHSETLAATKAGITTLCLPPDTDPIIDEPAVVELIQKRAQQYHAARVITLGALTTALQGKQLSEMAALKDAGCVGVSNALQPVQNSKILRRAMEYAASFDLTLHVVPLDPALAGQGVAHEGNVATQLGLQGIPVSAETVAIAQHLALIEEVGIQAHFGRLSSARAIDMIAEAKLRGLAVTADVAIHQLLLTEQAIAGFNSNAHVITPLRTENDRQALLKALKEGIIDAICSDHQPHEADAKLNPYPVTAPGISGIDTLLSLSTSMAGQHELTLTDIIKALSHTPAQILQIPYGTLAIGTAADICIYDPKEQWLINNDNINSAGKNTPFKNQTVSGKVKYTLVGGKIID